jgi:hypothetical protein
MKTILVALGVVLVCAGVSSAALRDSGAVYHGCVNETNGNLRVSDSCRTDERAIAWNETGPQGLQGPQGVPGAQGPKGDIGPQGPAGVVSLQSLAGTPCTRHDGTSATVLVSVGSDESIALSCGAPASADWCASNTPTVGPHMTVSCDSATHQLSYHCDAGWSDWNHDPSDGCELSTPLAPILLHNTVNPDGSVNAVLSGLEALSASAGGTWTVDVQPQCDDSASAACPGGTPSSPLPTMTVDQAKRAGDLPRAMFAAVPADTLIQTQFRVRVKTVTPIPVSVGGAHCNVAVDTTTGTTPDLTLSFDDVVDTVNAPDGPTVPGAVSLTGLEGADYSITPVGAGDFLCFGAAILPLSKVQAILTRALTPWATTRGQICGAPPEWFFQWCPAGVPTGP